MEFPKDLTWLNDDPLVELHALKFERLSEGQELFDVSMINPDIPPPRFVLDKLAEAAIKPDNHRYAVSRGIRKLRESFASKYERRFGVVLDSADEICVTLGTKDAILHSAMCLTKPGDRVLLPKPTYPAHLSAVKIARLEPSFFSLSEDEDRMLAEIGSKLESERFELMIVGFPNNPTGMTVGSGFYEKLAAITRRAGCFVINDFVYGEMGFGSKSPVSLLSAGASYDHLAESYSLSKAYSVPGWRVGALMGGAPIVQRLARLKSHIDYGIFLPVQMAAAAGLSSKEDLAAGIARQYMNRAGLLIAGLQNLGWQVTIPSAGACVWARIPSEHSGETSIEFAKRLLLEQGIMVMPGELFGREFSGFVRFALVQSETKIQRMIKCLQSMGRPEPKMEALECRSAGLQS